MITIILHLIGFFQLQKVKIKGPKIIKKNMRFVPQKLRKSFANGNPINTQSLPYT